MFVHIKTRKLSPIGHAEDREYARALAREGYGPDEVETRLMARGLDRDTARGIVRTLGVWRRYDYVRLYRMLGAVSLMLLWVAIGSASHWVGPVARRIAKDLHGAPLVAVAAVVLAVLVWIAARRLARADESLPSPRSGPVGSRPIR